MDTEQHESYTVMGLKQRRQRETIYWEIAAVCFLLSAGTVLGLTFGVWDNALSFYCLATFMRLAAGAIMNRMGDVETVNAWNDRHHRRLVIALNGVVGFVLLGRLVYDRFVHHTHGGALVFLALTFAAYFIAAKFTRPNSFGARMRSAMLTIVLVCTMAHLAWGQHWGLWVLSGVIALNFVWLRLRTLQRRFGLANR